MRLINIMRLIAKVRLTTRVYSRTLHQVPKVSTIGSTVLFTLMEATENLRLRIRGLCNCTMHSWQLIRHSLEGA